MKKICTSIFLVIFCQVGFAADEMPSLTSLSKFQNLINLFDSGEKISYADIKGYFFIGRCIQSNFPDRAYPGLLGHIKEEAGPGWEEKPLSLLTFAENKEESAFDNLPNITQVVNNVTTIMFKQYREQSSGIGLKDDLSSKTDFEPNSRPDSLLEFRKSGEYIISKETNLIKQVIDFIDGHALVEAGAPFAACYFKQKIDLSKLPPLPVKPPSNGGNGSNTNPNFAWRCMAFDAFGRQFWGKVSMSRSDAQAEAMLKCRVNSALCQPGSAAGVDCVKVGLH